jgi:hypothetical protein
MARPLFDGLLGRIADILSGISHLLRDESS